MIIGICGATASGKTTFVTKLAATVDSRFVAMLEHDAYYRASKDMPEPIRRAGNYDHPDSLDNELFIAHLLALRAQNVVERPVYDFVAHERTTVTVRIEPRPVIIVEGLLIFAIPQIRDLLDVRIFIDAPADLRFLRRLQRDMSERGRSAESVIAQYLDTVRPLHGEFVEPSRRHAHIIVPGEEDNLVAVDLIAAKIDAIILQSQRERPAPLRIGKVIA
jgi:uridine kinase